LLKKSNLSKLIGRGRMDIYMFIHILVPVVAAILLNVFIYTQGWNKENQQKEEPNKLLPPGFVIAIVWILILGLLGYTHYLVYPSSASWIIVAAVLYCLAYPFLTAGLQKHMQVLNALSFFVALAVTISTFIYNNFSALFTIPFLLWTAYVTIVTVFI
jgi:tryptophan-rich sensory protein